MPAFYSPRRGKCFTHYPRGILDGTDDEYEFGDDKESVSASPAEEDSELEEESDDDVVEEEEETVVPDNTGLEKENISTVEVKKEIVGLEEEDLDRKPAAKTKEELEREAAQKKREEEWGDDLIDEDLQRLLDDHMGVKRRPFKLVNLKWNNEKNKVKKVAKKPKAKKKRRAKKVEEEPASKKRKLLTAQEKSDQEYARSLHIQELLRMTRAKMA